MSDRRGSGAKGSPKIVYSPETLLRPEDDDLVHCRVMLEDLRGYGLCHPHDLPGGPIAFSATATGKP